MFIIIYYILALV